VKITNFPPNFSQDLFTEVDISQKKLCLARNIQE